MKARSDDYFCPPWLRDFSSVIDETQKIESNLFRSTHHCRLRVGVSGTPLANNRLADINPLCRFLH